MIKNFVMILNCDRHFPGDFISQAAIQNILGCQALNQDMSGSRVSISNMIIFVLE